MLSIDIVDYPLTAPGMSISADKIEKRMAEVREEIHVLLRPHVHLLECELVDRLTSSPERQICMRFELKLATQQKLAFSDNQSDGEKLHIERDALLGEALSLQERINRVALCIIGGRPGASWQDPDLMKLMHRETGRSIQLRFPHDVLNLSFPEMPLYTYGQPKLIAGTISEILASGRVGFREGSNSSHNPKKTLLIGFKPQELGCMLVLAFAKESRNQIRMVVRPVYKIDAPDPSHFELIEIPDRSMWLSEMNIYIQGLS